MAVTQEQATWFADAFNKLVGNVDQAILGKTHVPARPHLPPVTPYPGASNPWQ